MIAWLAKAGKYQIEKLPCPNPGQPVDMRIPATGVMHTTEGSFESALSVFRQHYAPNFLVGKDRNSKVRIVQLVPLGTMAAALENPPGGVETNRWARAQIEVVGFSKPVPWMFDPDTMDAVACLMFALKDVADIPLSRPFPETMPALPWATVSFPRRHADKWGKVGGWYGHVEVPENSHWDPGYLKWDSLLTAARAKQHPLPAPQPAPKPLPAQPEDDFIYLRDKDGQERWEPLTKSGAALRSSQWLAGKYQELRFKRK